MDRGVDVTVKSVDQAAVVVAASLLYKNWQRPGAVVNATLDDSKVTKNGSLYIMSVEHHKTALEGVAKVVMDAVDHGRVVLYVDTIRNVQVDKTDTNNLFILTGGRPLGNLSSKIKSIGNRLPSVTRVRKIGATSVALTLGQSPTANLVTRQMSHTINTEALHYQAIVGNEHAASAFTTMTQLRTVGNSSDVLSNTSRASTPCKAQRRRPFSAEETLAVQEYFGGAIEEHVSVPLADCKRFFQIRNL